MNIEMEVRVLAINKEEIQKKLMDLGAEFKWERLQKRYVYDFYPSVPHKWIRLRTNGVETTLTIKNIKEKTWNGTEEMEIVVDDFEKTNLLLKELGYTPKAFQENKRRKYQLNHVEVVIDSWPRIPDYLEIEGNSEEDILEVVHLLGFTKEDIVTKDVETIYKDYGIELNKIENLELESERK